MKSFIRFGFALFLIFSINSVYAGLKEDRNEVISAIYNNSNCKQVRGAASLLLGAAVSYGALTLVERPERDVKEGAFHAFRYTVPSYVAKYNLQADFLSCVRQIIFDSPRFKLFGPNGEYVTVVAQPLRRTVEKRKASSLYDESSPYNEEPHSKARFLPRDDQAF